MNKKLLMYSIVGILAIGFVFAAWAFSYNNTITATVLANGGVLLIVQDISDFSINTTSGNVTNVQNLSIFNRNGEKSAVLNLTVNKVLTELSCPNFINDCSVELKNSTSVINNGDNIVWFSGSNNFTLETSCVEFSCGQNITIELDIQ